MGPILRPGDQLRIIPYGGKPIRVGDVIVFDDAGAGHKVVHRVVSVDSTRIKTRGDNNKAMDDWDLSPSDILGRVVSALRDNRSIRVFGGPIGQLCCAVMRAIHSMDSRLSSSLRPVYERLAGSGFIRRRLPVHMKTRVIFFNRAEGTELQLLMGRRVIGKWLPGKSEWNIRRPFRLFVDETSLPENKTEVSGVGFQVSGVNKDK